MHEALAQFLRNADWTYESYGMFLAKETRRCWATRLPLDARALRRMDLNVGYLEQYEGSWDSHVLCYAHDHYNAVRIVAESLRNANVGLKSLRFIGDSESLLPRRNGVMANGQLGTIFHNLRTAFSSRSVSIPRYELGISNSGWRAMNGGMSKYWLLFDYTETSGMSLLVHERKRRVKERDPPPEKDLANLLPEGWVLPRRKCRNGECDRCYPSEWETWVPFDVPPGQESRGIAVTWGHESEDE
jgi:hypothetical protein